MRALTIADSANIILGLQDEIRRSEESRYDHRLHGVLLVAQGLTCPEVAGLLGDAPRSVEYWVGSFEKSGLSGLREGERSGRPSRLDEKQLRGINAALRQTPRDMGLGGTLWDGKTLAAWIAEEYEIDLGVRQCQRLFRQLGFRLRKPRPSIAQADPVRQKAHKKTPNADARRDRGCLGHRRSAFPTARFPLPDVDSAGDQRSGLTARSHAAQCGILRRRAVAGREIPVLPGSRQIQRRDLLCVHEKPPPRQHPNGTPSGCHH